MHPASAPSHPSPPPASRPAPAPAPTAAMDFERIDELGLALMASAPIARCRCPLAPRLECDPARCGACHASLVQVVDWAHSNIADVNGQRVSRQYLRRALMWHLVRWNQVRRGLMEPTAAMPPAAVVVSAHFVADVGSCAICLDAVTQGQQVYLPCTHSYHGECIGRWLRTQRTCPTCRTPF